MEHVEQRRKENKPELVIVKIGGSAITHKEQDRRAVNREALDGVASAIARVKKNNPDLRIIVVHGAGSFAHGIAKAAHLTEPLSEDNRIRQKQLKGIAKVNINMHTLNGIVTKAISRASEKETGEVEEISGAGAIPHQSSASGFLNNRQITHFNTDNIRAYIDQGLIVVTHADMMPDSQHEFAIMSGDQLTPHLAKELSEHYNTRIVLASDVDGVYDHHPEHPEAKIIEMIDHSNFKDIDFGGTKGTDVTGGMGAKVKTILDYKLDATVVNARDPHQLEKALIGLDRVGTRIMGKKPKRDA